MSNPQQSPDDEVIIKSILQVSLDPNEKSKEFTFLSKLYDKLTAVQNVASSFGSPPIGNSPQNSLQAILQSTLTSLLPGPQLDLIPCENCSKLFPMNEIMDHENLCGIVPASSMPPSVPTSFSQPIPSSVPRAPVLPPKIDRGLLSSILQERLLMFAGISCNKFF